MQKVPDDMYRNCCRFMDFSILQKNIWLYVYNYLFCLILNRSAISSWELLVFSQNTRAFILMITVAASYHNYFGHHDAQLQAVEWLDKTLLSFFTIEICFYNNLKITTLAATQLMSVH